MEDFCEERFEDAIPVSSYVAPPTVPNGRTMPASIEAEEQLLSCCLLDGKDVVARCLVAHVGVPTFYDTKNGIVFGAILRLYERNAPIDIATVSEELKAAKEFDSIGGYPFLTQISSRIPTTAQADFFIDTVRHYSVRREVIRSATGIVEDTYGYDGDFDGYLANVANKFASVINQSSANDTGATLKQMCDGIAAEASAVIGGTLRGDENDLSWGFSDADRFLKPFRRGELVCLAARPGVGKSSLMRQIVFKNVVRDHRHAMIFTWEVTAEEFLKNTAQAASGVNPREIRSYSATEQQSFLKWVGELGELGKTLQVRPANCSLATLLANVKLAHARLPVDFVAVDYLQLINEKMDKGENRDQLLGRVTRALKQLANELQCVVLILSQLNRLSERENRSPHLADLRESGNIEQDCDRVVFIHRPTQNPLTNLPQDFTDDMARHFYCDLLQRKGRNVGEHALGLQFERAAARFLPIVKGPATQSP